MPTFQSAMPLLLAWQAFGQATLYGAQVPARSTPYPASQMRSQLGAPSPQLQTPSAVGQGDALSPPMKYTEAYFKSAGGLARAESQEDTSLPSRAEILKEQERYLAESRENVAAATRKILAETEASRREIFADVERSKQEYLAILEEKTRPHLQDMGERLARRRAEIEDAGKEYAERLEKQAEELLDQLFRKKLQARHQRALLEEQRLKALAEERYRKALVEEKLQKGLAKEKHQKEMDEIMEDELAIKQELEEEIRGTYEAVRAGRVVDAGPGVQAAREKFEAQIIVLAERRQDVEAEFESFMRKETADFEELADELTEIWN